MGQSKEVPRPEEKPKRGHKEVFPSGQDPKDALQDALRTMKMDQKVSKEVNAMFEKAKKKALGEIRSIEVQQNETFETLKTDLSDSISVFRENSLILKLYHKNRYLSENEAAIVFKAYKTLDHHIPDMSYSINRAENIKADFVGRFENSARPGKHIDPASYTRVIEYMDDIINTASNDFSQLSETKEKLGKLYLRGFDCNIDNDVRDNRWKDVEVVEEKIPENKEVRARFERAKDKTTGEISSIRDAYVETRRVATEWMNSIAETFRVAKKEKDGTIVIRQSDAAILFTAYKTIFSAEKNIKDYIKSASKSREAFKVMFETSVMKREISSKSVYDVTSTADKFIKEARGSLQELFSTRADLHKVLQDSGLRDE